MFNSWKQLIGTLVDLSEKVDFPFYTNSGGVRVLQQVSFKLDFFYLNLESHRFYWFVCSVYGGDVIELNLLSL